MMRTLFLNPPSYAGFDGGAGARYQAKREIRSYWYPTWLAQPAALVPGSRLVDAPPAGLTTADVIPLARGYDLAVLHTSSPTFAGDVTLAEALKAQQPGPAHRLGRPEGGRAAGPVAAGIAGRRLRSPRGVRLHHRRGGRGTPAGLRRRAQLHRPRTAALFITQTGAILPDMDLLPFVTPVYKRDLRIEDYYIGYLRHPYVSLYTGRGCRSRCTFCLWPQTVGGHLYRTRSVDSVLAEAALAARTCSRR